MKIKNIIKGIECKLVGNEEENITNISCDSRNIKFRGLFVCLVGTKIDGHDFIDEAIKNGAKAIVVSKKLKEKYSDINIIKVDDTRIAMSDIAANFYGKKFNFNIIGFTGTNGKTTSTFMLASILNYEKKKVAVIGTSGVFLGTKQIRGENLTTPDPIELFELLRELEKENVEFVLMEMSAHALYFHKNRGIMTDIAVFSNLTEDHLDFFGDMENYGKAKALFFEKEASKLGVINLDDEFGKGLYENASISKVSFSTRQKADYFASNINLKMRKFIAVTPKNKYKIKLTMSGEYNISNALSTIACAEHFGISKASIKKGLKYLPEVSGRFNIFDFGNHGKVILDFAHTPDGLEKILDAAKLLGNKKSKIISVFGCGGNRDRAKRPIMGEIAGTHASFTFVSIDNPRYEDPNIVMEDIAVGLKRVNAPYKIVMPREKAVEEAILMSGKNDIVVVSGKGTEPYYEVCGVKHPYNEADVIVALQKKYKE